jgi:dsRNA-specific ribonuclease
LYFSLPKGLGVEKKKGVQVNFPPYKGIKNPNYPPKPQKPLTISGKHPVSVLMEMCSKNHWDPPQWNTVEEGPPHKRVFVTTVTVQGQVFKPDFYVNNKKQSKSDAALQCLKHFGLAPLL